MFIELSRELFLATARPIDCGDFSTSWELPRYFIPVIVHQLQVPRQLIFVDCRLVKIVQTIDFEGHLLFLNCVSSTF